MVNMAEGDWMNEVATRTKNPPLQSLTPEGDWMNEVATRTMNPPLQSPASAQCGQTRSRHS